MSADLSSLLATAHTQRAALLAQLAAEATDIYRLFHGDSEGLPGLQIDRYGDLLLVEAFARPLSEAELAAIRSFYAGVLPGLSLVYNERCGAERRIRNPLLNADLDAAMLARAAQELGVHYLVQARHAGQDPWLSPERRALRRLLMQEAPGKEVLNLFAGVGSAGLAAAKAGARYVLNVEYDETQIMLGKEQARQNTLATRPRFVQSDVLAAVRQLSGIGQPRMVRGKRMPAFPELEARQFDLVVLDPPAYQKSLFGVVDPARDYPTVFKPALLATAEGGSLLCCNPLPEPAGEAWLDQLQRSAVKAGRTVRSAELIAAEADIPGTTGFSLALLRV